MNDENKVVVKIFGDDYPITGVADPAYISRVADYVDAKMKETAKVSRIKSRDKVAILAAMSIASEFYETREQLSSATDQLGGRLDSLLERLDSALADTV
ncbi:MAG: cell division protein ZapA [bacterium]|nr:cell division protein ZapA [bacterium]